jgi:hypothetical protein
MKEIELLNLELTDEQKKKILKNSKTYATMERLCQRILNGDFCYRSLNMIDSLFRMYSAELQKELDPRELLYQEFKENIMIDPNKFFEFEVVSGKVCVTDPCYNRGTWCGNFDLPAKKGKWRARIHYRDEGSWGIRVHSLFVVHENHKRPEKYTKEDALPNSVGVDSGTAGVFCSSIYPHVTEDEKQRENPEFKKFYDACGEQSLDFPDHAGVVWNKGIVSATGYGDGGYSGYGSKDENGDYVSFQIYYL